MILGSFCKWRFPHPCSSEVRWIWLWVRSNQSCGVWYQAHCAVCCRWVCKIFSY